MKTVMFLHIFEDSPKWKHYRISIKTRSKRSRKPKKNNAKNNKQLCQNQCKNASGLEIDVRVPKPVQNSKRGLAMERKAHLTSKTHDPSRTQVVCKALSKAIGLGPRFARPRPRRSPKLIPSGPKLLYLSLRLRFACASNSPSLLLRVRFRPRFHLRFRLRCRFALAFAFASRSLRVRFAFASL